MTQKNACLILNESGSCTVEYAFTVGLMSLFILTGVAQLGPKIVHVFQLASCIDVCVLHKGRANGALKRHLSRILASAKSAPFGLRLNPASRFGRLSGRTSVAIDSRA